MKEEDTVPCGAQASGAQQPSGGSIGSRRAFFPCNREDALLLLGGLCISHWFPERTVRLPVDASGVVVVSQGLREEEGALICGAAPERFPLLIELDGEPDATSPRIIRLVDVLRLVFRSQDEADAFRYRPVEEFDPVDLAWSVEPELFGLPGDARFMLRNPEDSPAVAIGRLADRIVAAVFTLLEVGNRHEAAREPILGFVRGSGHGSVQQEPDLQALLRHLSQGLHPPVLQLVDAVLAAFAGSEGRSSREIVESMARKFKALSKPEDRVGEVAGRWLDVARDVGRGQIELNGDLLSDERSILLRAALLGAFADDAAALLTFLNAEKPAGPRVAATASFLVGLKVGVIGDSWDNKRRLVDKLSAAIAALLRAWPEVVNGEAPLVRATERCGDAEIVQVLSIGDVVLAEWKTPRAAEMDPIQQAWLEQLMRAGYEVAGSGANPRSWLVRLPSAEHTVEVLHAEAGNPPRRFPVLRFHFAEGEKLRKGKDIAASFEAGGRLWYARQDTTKRWFLSCEVPSLPVGDDMKLVADALEAAVQLCVAPAKAPRKARPKGAATKVARAKDAQP
ncbi:hypothetical protein JNX00_20450 [Hydrogenophaga sp. YM1]|uniref:hypothetical protein n=1 Tax=Hydrogenophaga sp. YM1 TaxID=2806262 RepID=UPI00195CF968|nr:hypothetical protein [Hydrogenophaga sp. YM1]QRR33973.1 hypothetical protein JNX00_20450 [Hydrogenophaga sp. YM1]